MSAEVCCPHIKQDLPHEIINKEHGGAARDATVSMALAHLALKSAEVMFLRVSNGDVAATNGITLGGAPITNNTPWLGQWKPLMPVAAGRCTVIVPAASAAIVKISDGDVHGS